ncbi:MAG: hypothetical protein JWN27_2023 [Candidatus Eremiobacteraeota bacterium]|nr:hypothetical protein [Candidatus Eremiobacteraeota bacterium]
MPEDVRDPPLVVTFFFAGTELRARVRDVSTQEQWVVLDGSALRRALFQERERAV